MIALTLLALIGLAFAVHSICLANAIPDQVPLVFSVLVITMFTTSVAGVVFSAFGDARCSSIALLLTCLAYNLYRMEAKRRHYKIAGLTVVDYSSQQ